jgi:hypothetical protein
MAPVIKFVIEAENKRVLLLLILPSFWKNGRTAWLILLSQPTPSHSNTKSRNGVVVVANGENNPMVETTQASLFSHEATIK